MTESPRHSPSPATDRVARSSATVGPYAGPGRARAARPEPDERKSTPPYVPAPFRGKPVVARVVDDTEELPSIDAFVATSVDDSAPATASTSEHAAAGEAGQWPIDEAGAELQRIGELFDEPAPAPTEPAALFAGALDDVVDGSPSDSSKQMWRTDEWMDIMPVSPAPDATEASAGSVARDARNARDDASEAESRTRNDDASHAADALEAIAQRVRAGEITISGYDQSMTDATLLASLLTALLGRGR